MKFITSISPKRIERQQYCMATWLQYGEIVAVQTVEEIPLLQAQFPNVHFVATDRTGKELFGYPSRVNISAIVEQGPGLIINSDIKIDTTQRQFDADWKPKPKQFNVGVRYDFDGPGKPKFLNKHGIDAFLITEEIMSVMEDHGFVIGVPVWDSWIVWHMLTHRFKIKAKLTPGLLHLTHPLGWSDQDLAKGLAIMQGQYGIGQKGLSVAVSDVTGRLNVKHGRHNTPMVAVV
jgi:hypothetical protein